MKGSLFLYRCMPFPQRGAVCDGRAGIYLIISFILWGSSGMAPFCVQT